MDEIEGYDEDLGEALDDLQAFIIRIQKLPEDKRAFEAKKMEGKLKAANDLYKAFEAELRELPKSDAAKFLKRGEEHKNAIAEIQTRLNQLKSEAQRADLGLAKREKTTEEIIAEAKDTQTKSKASTERSKAIVQETIGVGAATVDQLKKDTEQLERATETMDDITDELSIARKQLVAFARRMATDRLIRALLILVLLGLLFIVIWVIVKPRVTPAPAAPPA